MRRQTFVDIFSCLFIALFVYAALSKLLDYEKFRVDLGQSPLLTPFVGLLSISVPLIELAIVALLILPKMKLAGLYASLVLMVMFTTYIVIVSRFSDDVPCSCGGILAKLGWGEHLVFNSVFVVLVMVLILAHVGTTRKKNFNIP